MKAKQVHLSKAANLSLKAELLQNDDERELETLDDVASVLNTLECKFLRKSLIIANGPANRPKFVA